MEELFPGMTDELVAAGVPYKDPALDSKYASKFGWFPRQPSTMRMLQPTRRYLEWYLRKRAQSLPNVEFVPQTMVTGLVTENAWATGVRVDALDTGEAAEIRGDLIVDVSGRGSRAPEWLAAAGYPAPEETTVNARWGYATTYVKVPDGWDPGYGALYVGPTVSGEGPAASRGAAMWPQEGNLVVVTAQGCAADYPPGDMESFREYIDSFGAPEFGKLIDEYGAVAPVEAWRNTTNRMRDYVGLAARPEGFVAVGDAVAAFNPIYGQGMPMAAAGARALRDSIAAHKSGGTSDLAGFAQMFHSALREVLMPCWEFSTSSDFNVPGVEVNGVTQENARSPESEYADRVLALATEDPDIALKFMETINLVRGTEWLADEALQTRVMANWDRLGSLTRTGR
jgi:2-polyprenyl-6-methoxyphenol hydroxylase-like FAD-dependent oxidoreductase